MIQHFTQNQEQDMSKEAQQIAKSELDYYFSAGNRDKYESPNAV
jgi:hypothetical protein